MTKNSKAIQEHVTRISQENREDIEYSASLLKQLKTIADQSGHRMLYHLINMAEMEANSILSNDNLFEE